MTILHHRRYESAAAWFQQCEADSTHPLTLFQRSMTAKQSAYDDHSPGMYFDWSQSKTRGEVLEYANTGWQEGRDKITAALAAAKPILRSATVPAISLDVAGSYPIVPAYIAGAPDCMVSIGQDERQTKPIVRLVLEMWGSAGVSAARLTTRGAAIMAHIDRLEEAGIRVELTVRYSSSNCDSFQTYKAKTSNYIVDILAKEAGDTLEIDRLSFLLLHPSALRRLYFGSMYTLPKDCAAGWISGYGSPPTESAREVEAGQILIPSANEYSNSYDAPEKALDQIGTFITDGIKSMGDMGFLVAAGIIKDSEA